MSVGYIILCAILLVRRIVASPSDALAFVARPVSFSGDRPCKRCPPVVNGAARAGRIGPERPGGGAALSRPAGPASAGAAGAAAGRGRWRYPKLLIIPDRAGPRLGVS